MPYTKTTWQDRQVEHPNRYNKSSENSTEVVLTPSPGNVLRQGTPISAANMNKIEQGIADALALAEAAETPAGAQAKANQAETNAKNASLPRTGGTLTGALTVNGNLQGQNLRVTSGYFTLDSYSIAEYGTGRLETFYDANNQRWSINGRNTANQSVPVTLWANDFRAADGTTMTSLKQSVSNGKATVAAAITDMGVSTAATAEFATMATNIRAIQTLGFIQGTGTWTKVGQSVSLTVRGLSFRPSVVTIYHSFAAMGGYSYINKIPNSTDGFNCSFGAVNSAGMVTVYTQTPTMFADGFTATIFNDAYGMGIPASGTCTYIAYK